MGNIGRNVGRVVPGNLRDGSRIRIPGKRSAGTIRRGVTVRGKSGRRDLNPGPPAPEAGALTGLRYAPFLNIKD